MLAHSSDRELEKTIQNLPNLRVDANGQDLDPQSIHQVIGKTREAFAPKLLEQTKRLTQERESKENAQALLDESKSTHDMLPEDERVIRDALARLEAFEAQQADYQNPVSLEASEADLKDESLKKMAKIISLNLAKMLSSDSWNDRVTGLSTLEQDNAVLSRHIKRLLKEQVHLQNNVKRLQAELNCFRKIAPGLYTKA